MPILIKPRLPKPLPLRKQITELPENQRWMVTSEGAFSYLARDLGLKELYLWPINADQQGTPQQVRKVVDIVKKIISRQSLARVRFPINQRVRLRVKPAHTTAVCSMSIP